MRVLFERSRPETCLSDLALDRLVAGELGVGKESEARAHLERCDACAARLADLEADARAFAAVAPPLRLPEPRRRRWIWPGAAAAVAAAAVLLVAVWPRERIETTRAKGGPALTFFVKRGDAVRAGTPGEVVHPGDRLRFAYSSRDGRYLTVLSVDGAGTASVYFPAGDEPFWAEPGAEVPLPLATELDGVLGRERLYGVFCEAPVPPAELLASLSARPQSPVFPAGCSTRILEVVKEPAP